MYLTLFLIHVISPLQDLTLYAAASTPGPALNEGVQRKMTAHLSDCRATGMDSVPIVVETLGGLSEDAIFTVWQLGMPTLDVLAQTIPLPVLVSFFTT